MDESKIVETRGLVFLGAGASQRLRKMLMGEFVDNLSKNNPPDKELFEAIVSRKRDLEFLLQELDALASKDYLLRMSPIPALGTIRTVPAGLGDSSIRDEAIHEILNRLASNAKRTADWVKKEVFLHYRSLILDPAVQESYKNLLTTVDLNRNLSVVFTTNYDPAIEEFCRLEKMKLVDGFVNDEFGGEYYWDRSTFEKVITKSPSTQKSVLLFKLHGSTTWVRQGHRVIKGRPVYVENDPAIENVLIYPATRKVAIDDPYFTAYDYLQRFLSSAEFCVFVGYSFRDYDVLTRLRASQLWNPGLKIIVLDPNAQRLIKKTLQPNGIRAVAVPFLFSTQEDLYLPRLQEILQQRSNQS